MLSNFKMENKQINIKIFLKEVQSHSLLGQSICGMTETFRKEKNIIGEEVNFQ